MFYLVSNCYHCISVNIEKYENILIAASERSESIVSEDIVLLAAMKRRQL